jgi:uncharacterized protein YdhG (YjbR/CyaY superfamily)
MGFNASPEIDAYIAQAPDAAQPVLQQIRELTRLWAPEATEVISYGMPTVRMKKIILHYAAFKNHVGLFPGAAAIEAARAEWGGYISSKGTAQIPHGTPLPEALVQAFIAFNLARQ